MGTRTLRRPQQMSSCSWFPVGNWWLMNELSVAELSAKRSGSNVRKASNMCQGMGVVLGLRSFINRVHHLECVCRGTYRFWVCHRHIGVGVNLFFKHWHFKTCKK